MAKNTNKPKSEPKQPKTIKVVTLVKAAAIVAAVVAAYVAGSMQANASNAKYQTQVKAEAKAIVAELKPVQ